MQAAPEPCCVVTCNRGRGLRWVVCHERCQEYGGWAIVREMKEGPSGSVTSSLIPSRRPPSGLMWATSCPDVVLTGAPRACVHSITTAVQPRRHGDGLRHYPYDRVPMRGANQPWPKQAVTGYGHATPVPKAFCGRAWGDHSPRTRSEGRRCAIAAHAPRTTLERSVGLFDSDDEDLGAGLEICPVPQLVNDDGRIRRHGDFLFAILVLQRQRSTVGGGADLLDIRVRHRAMRPEIPRVVSFSGPTHCLGKDVHLEGAQAAVGLRHGGDAHEGTLLDVGKRRLDEGRNRGLGGHRQLQFGAVPCLDHIDGVLDTLNCAAHPDGRGILRPYHGRRHD